MLDFKYTIEQNILIALTATFLIICRSLSLTTKKESSFNRFGMGEQNVGQTFLCFVLESDFYFLVEIKEDF